MWEDLREELGRERAREGLGRERENLVCWIRLGWLDVLTDQRSKQYVFQAFCMDFQ